MWNTRTPTETQNVYSLKERKGFEKMIQICFNWKVLKVELNQINFCPVGHFLREKREQYLYKNGSQMHVTTITLSFLGYFQDSHLREMCANSIHQIVSLVYDLLLSACLIQKKRKYRTSVQVPSMN